MHRFDKLSVMPKTEQTGGTSFLERNLKGNENLAVWDGELYLEMHRGTFTTKIPDPEPCGLIAISP